MFKQHSNKMEALIVPRFVPNAGFKTVLHKKVGHERPEIQL